MCSGLGRRLGSYLAPPLAAFVASIVKKLWPVSRPRSQPGSLQAVRGQALDYLARFGVLFGVCLGFRQRLTEAAISSVVVINEKLGVVAEHMAGSVEGHVQFADDYLCHSVFSFGVFPPFVKNRIEEKIFIVNIYYETFFFFFIQQKKPGDRAMLKIFVQGMKKGGP